MKWKYYIPHYWESPEDRTTWEDVYLIPEDGGIDDESIWFTLDAIGSPPAGLPDGDEWFEPRDKTRERNLRYLGDRDYLITNAPDMLIRAEDFNQRDLIEWTKVFIQDQFGDPDPVLIEGGVDDFSRTNKHSAEIDRVIEALEAGVPEEEIINYRQRTCDAAPDEE